MAHTAIKFVLKKEKDSNEFFKRDINGNITREAIDINDAKSWHLASNMHDGESTACGQVYWDYMTESKTVSKGGITCADCLKTIKYYQSINL